MKVMDIPFTTDQFFDVFEAYNTAIWPAQVAAYVLGVMAIFLAWREGARRSRIVAGILALFWVWMGVVYHVLHFTRINPAAWIFAAFFVLEGLVLFLAGAVFAKLRFRFTMKPIPMVGAGFLLYALVVYPLLGWWFGHEYPRTPVFGVAPCPATIFTFGLLLWACRPVPWHVVVIPFLWSLLGVSAALQLGVPEDYGLGIAGVVGTVLVGVRNRQLRRDSTT